MIPLEKRAFIPIDLSVKYLSSTEWIVFGSIRYPIASLLNVTVAGMYYPKVGVAPLYGLIIGNNIAFSFLYQYSIG